MKMRSSYSLEWRGCLVPNNLRGPSDIARGDASASGVCLRLAPRVISSPGRIYSQTPSTPQGGL